MAGGTIESFHKTGLKARNPALIAQRCLPADEWIPEEEALVRLSDKNQLERLRRRPNVAVYDETGNSRVVPDMGFQPPPLTGLLADARSFLESLVWLGVVEIKSCYEDRPCRPGEHLVRMKNQRELQELEQKYFDAKKQQSVMYVDITDADGRTKRVPVDDRDNEVRIVLQEIRRRKAENARAVLEGRAIPWPQNQ